MLLEIENRIAETEKNLWQKLDHQNLREECKKEEDWILDPCHNAGKLSLYERTMELYWVMENIIGHLMWEK